jgi:putative DNA primase/helicase
VIQSLSTKSVDLTLEAQRITKKLGGRWDGRSGMACCPAHRDRTPSLSISAGTNTVLLHCFAGCDFVNIIRAVRAEGALETGHLPTDPNGRDAPIRDRSALARKIWGEARPIKGTLAERYLKGRGLVPPWEDLRFHPRTPVGSGATLSFRPAKIAAIRDRSGLIAIQRTILDPVTGGKATDLLKAKLCLGAPLRGAVRLAKAGHTLGLAEGIETAKSAIAMLGIPVWATLGNERFPLVDLPFDVTRLMLLPDRGPAGDRAATLAVESHAREGRSIEIVLPPDDHKDWNDADQARQEVERAGGLPPLLDLLAT